MAGQAAGAPASGPGNRGPSAGPLLFVGVVATLLLIGAALFTLRDILTKGRLEQWSYVFEDANLLPQRAVDLPQPESTVRIFYVGTDGKLAPYVHRLRRDLETRQRERFVLDHLFEPSPNPRLKSAVPKGTSLRGFYILGRDGYIDVSKEFLQPDKPTPQGERLAVYSLVNAIVLNSRDIDGVQILVDGHSIQSAWGWLDCSSPLAANLSANQ